MFYDLNGEILVNFIHQIEHKMANNVDRFIGTFFFFSLSSFISIKNKNETRPQQRTYMPLHCLIIL